MEFIILKDLVTHVAKKRPKHIPVLGNPGERESLVEAFYKGLVNGEIQSDKEAVKKFFNTSDVKDARYLSLKNRLARHTVNTVFFIDQDDPRYTDLAKAYVNCYKEFAAAEVLVSFAGLDMPAYFIFKQVLEQSIRYEFDDLTGIIIKRLIYIAILIKEDKSELKILEKIQSEYEQKKEVLGKLEKIFENIKIYYSANKSPNPQLSAQLKTTLAEIDISQKLLERSSIFFKYGLIEIAISFLNGDYSSALTLSNYYLQKINSYNSVRPGQIFLIRNNSIFLKIHLNAVCLTDLLDEIKDSYRFVGIEGGANWSRLKIVEMIYFLNVKDFHSAIKAFLEFEENPRRTLAEEASFNEEIKIIKGYLQLIGTLGILNEIEVKDILPFKESKFRNDFQILDKEKSGMNIPITFLPILISIAKGEDPESSMSMDALEKYRQRYLGKDLNTRSNLFAKFLIFFYKLKQFPQEFQKKVVLVQKKLEENPRRFSKQSLFVEIISYEDLINFLMERIHLLTINTSQSLQKTKSN